MTDLASWPVRIPRSVYIGDFNLAAHVGNVRYVEWMNIARTDLNVQAGLIADLEQHGAIATHPVPVVSHFAITYRFPLVTLDPVGLLSRVAAIDGDAFVQEHAIFVPHRDDVCARGESRLVMVDPGTGRKTAMTGAQRERLRAFSS